MRSTGRPLPEPRLETITESRWSKIDLDSSEEALLLSAGQALARGTDRYGAEQADSQASLLQVRRVDEKLAEVRVLDAVGILAIPTLQINVRPKIPVDHLLYILQAAEVVPRHWSGEGVMEQSENLAALIAHWFVTASERVLAHGLARDYRQHRDELSALRGRILALDTARLFYRGRVAVAAEYEEYDFDTPLNRTILHVARIVATGSALPGVLRRRALRVVKRMDGVGRLRRTDPTAQVDRRTSYYRDALSLARQILSATGRTLDVGEQRSWTFLFRTPSPVEAGIRALIRDALAGVVDVRKRQLALAGASLTINPDLVFEDSAVRAVGDVKYKLVGAEWDRSDLYEVVAFAAGYRVDRAIVTLFAEPGAAPLRSVSVGDHRVKCVCWPAAASRAPSDAAKQVAEAVRQWYLAGAPSSSATAVLSRSRALTALTSSSTRLGANRAQAGHL